MRTTLVRLTARLRAVSSKSCSANVFGKRRPDASTYRSTSTGTAVTSNSAARSSRTVSSSLTTDA